MPGSSFGEGASGARGRQERRGLGEEEGWKGLSQAEAPPFPLAAAPLPECPFPSPPAAPMVQAAFKGLRPAGAGADAEQRRRLEAAELAAGRGLEPCDLQKRGSGIFLGGVHACTGGGGHLNAAKRREVLDLADRPP